MLARTVEQPPQLCRPSGPAWHVVYTSPQSESIARDGIEALGFEPYMPVECITKVQRRRIVPIVRPLFPRYLFVGVPELEDWSRTLEVDGVEDVLRNNEIPSRVPVAWIELIRKMEDVGAFDHRKNAPTPFEIGEMVRVSDGPFSGFNALIESFVARLKSTSPTRRAKVLLEFLGRKTSMEMDVIVLEKL